MKQLSRLTAFFLFMFSLAGCAATQGAAVIEAPTVVKTSPVASPPFAEGISGLAAIDGNTYLVVHDALSFEDDPRLSIMIVSAKSGAVFEPLVVDDWRDPDGRPSDLESVCMVPGRENEFLIAESGYWQGKYGRLFHLRLDRATRKAEVLGVTKLPKLADNNSEQVGDQYEGVACMVSSGSGLVLVLGERGGSPAFPSGVLRWAKLELEPLSLSFTKEGLEGLTVEAPGNWSDSLKNRDISDLYIDPLGNLWISACEDPGDSGPFYSVVFRAGSIVTGGPAPVVLESEPVAVAKVEGLKVEGLAEPSEEVAAGGMCIGSDDEVYGGVSRFLRHH
ncbi:hypothetical protein CHL67_09335 [Prosthecochloris sp. GSB1]|uniref:hypothetical protein n=1 Tax=Prosthecochloris sp. GSB1 TaxID=281093 RepID=UPI000B8D0DEB|nr:hypothetical protein [Prosthecochloris sp. GSB1]ASQ91091.1 hypothetical protein CHL67_09335 [Prosthecochloris sp. GSB1]